MLSFLKEQEIPIQNNKILIPEGFKTLNIDIGLSFCACHTQQWLNKTNDLFVLSIEALKSNINKLTEGKQTTYHHRPANHYLNKDYINKRCFLLPCAVGLTKTNKTKFFECVDPGQCSIYHPPTSMRPEIYSVKQIIDINIFNLSDILKIIPWDKFSYVGFIKIDVQGADLDVVKSGGDILKEKVVYITLEGETTYSSKNNNGKFAIYHYMKSIGFTQVNLKTTRDPTYINNKFINLYPPKKHNIVCIQNN